MGITDVKYAIQVPLNCPVRLPESHRGHTPTQIQAMSQSTPMSEV